MKIDEDGVYCSICLADNGQLCSSFTHSILSFYNQLSSLS